MSPSEIKLIAQATTLRFARPAKKDNRAERKSAASSVVRN
jgi:hypothetical protein